MSVKRLLLIAAGILLFAAFITPRPAKASNIRIGSYSCTISVAKLTLGSYNPLSPSPAPGGSQTVGDQVTVGSPVEEDTLLYVSIPALQSVKIGDYSDSITIGLSF